jgi:hypothetical protein
MAQKIPMDRKKCEVIESDLQTALNLVTNSQLEVCYIIQRLKNNTTEYNSHKKSEMTFESLDKVLKLLSVYCDKRPNSL